MQIVLSRGERDDWFADPFIVTLTVIAATCLPLFIWWERRPDNRNPIISLATYRTRNFVLGSIYVVVLGMMLYGQLYFVPQFLRNVQHHSAFGTGQMQTINAVWFTVGLIVGAQMIKRLGFRAGLGVGAAAFMAGMLLWTFRLTLQISDEAMYLPLALTGFGAGWQIGPISTLIASQTPNTQMGEAMELYLCQRQLGGSWGTAILTIIVDQRRSFWSSRLGESLNDFSLYMQDAMREQTATFLSTGLPPSHAAAASMGLLHARLQLQSVVNAFADTFAYQACIGAFALLLVIFFARGRAIKTAVNWAIHMTR
jgi:DHA2 family multidrug resistance protein